MTRRALGGFGAAAVLALAVVGFLPRPALAAAPVITLSSPTGTVTTAVVVAGEAYMQNNGRVDWVRADVASTQPNHDLPQSSFSVTGNQQSLPFSFNVAVPFNGIYQVTVTTAGTDQPFDIHQEGSQAGPVSFAVAIPPAPPSGVKTTVDEAKRTVKVSWTPNSEPDVIGYSVWRKEGTQFKRRAVLTDTSYVDDLGSLPAGTYQYQVFAARPNAAGDDVVISGAAPTSAKVTSSPPTPPTTTATGGTGGPTGKATTTTAAPGSKSPTLATHGKADLSGFAALLPSGSSKLPSVRSTPAPDPGFNDQLPFDGNAAATDSTAPGRDDVQALGGQTLASSNDQDSSSLRFMAAGLLVTVVLMHLLWLREEVNREPRPAIAPEELPES